MGILLPLTSSRGKEYNNNMGKYKIIDWNNAEITSHRTREDAERVIDEMIGNGIVEGDIEVICGELLNFEVGHTKIKEQPLEEKV